MPSETEIINALRAVIDPELNRNIVDLGMVRNLAITPSGMVSFTLAFTIKGCPLKDQITRSAHKAVSALPGVNGVEIIQGEMTAGERQALFGEKTNLPPRLAQFNQVRQVIAVMSGKGGVGKSSVTALLAVALSRQGLKAGILDADITGPSIPRLFGLPPGGVETNDLGILPLVTPERIKVMSANLLVKSEDDPIIWRGPMISATIKQFWEDVIWGKLDVLLVDLPPGTSDANLTVMQSIPVNGVILVTTPQELAGMVVRKAARMLDHLNIPIVGLVENMSFYTCPETGSRHEIFGPSHAGEIAEKVQISAWTKLPINPLITRAGDQGEIETVDLPELRELANGLALQIFTPAIDH
jgi:ATP-binding protein involved in chromosome partitioning